MYCWISSHGHTHLFSAFGGFCADSCRFQSVPLGLFVFLLFRCRLFWTRLPIFFIMLGLAQNFSVFGCCLRGAGEQAVSNVSGLLNRFSWGPVYVLVIVYPLDFPRGYRTRMGDFHRCFPSLTSLQCPVGAILYFCPRYLFANSGTYDLKQLMAQNSLAFYFGGLLVSS